MTVFVKNYRIIAARCEQVAVVRCNKRFSLVTADFEAHALPDVQGVIITKARVIPNVDGDFYLTLLNTTEDDIKIDARKVVGFIHPPDQIVSGVEKRDNTTLTGITIGENLNGEEKSVIQNLVNEYEDIFAVNPKCPKQSKLV